MSSNPIKARKTDENGNLLIGSDDNCDDSTLYENYSSLGNDYE